MALGLPLLAYFSGSVMGSRVAGFLLGGTDPSSTGSGNLGATNSLRVRGPVFALMVLVVDAGKGALAVSIVHWLPVLPEMRSYLILGCAVGVTLGHVFPVYLHFRGGKGAATLIGVFAAIIPEALIPAALVWFIMLSFYGYVSLATLSGGLVLALITLIWWQSWPMAVLGLFCMTLLLWTHRENISRLFMGNENRFEKAMFLRRLWSKLRGRLSQ